jgi:hypothetical protein
VKIGQKNLKDVICFYKMLSRFWFRQYDEAARFPSRRVIGFLDIYHVFFEGLVAMRMARRKDEDEQKWTEIAKKAVVSLETWGGYCAWNFSNKASLLRAELHFLRGEHAEVEKKYKASVLLAYKHHFLHEEGLAMELLGMFYMSIGNKEAAKSSLMGAQACYVRWGANAALDEHLSTL